ncbi:MAG: hypothetical protein C0617_02820, partial [Desulfuromonas sp.]
MLMPQFLIFMVSAGCGVLPLNLTAGVVGQAPAFRGFGAVRWIKEDLLSDEMVSPRYLLRRR